jgi:lipopolysaccharide cholinephosphotransferase
VPPKSGPVVKVGSKLILACTPVNRRPYVRQKLLKRIIQYNRNNNFETAAIETMASLRKPFASDMLDSYVDLPFEDSQFMCFAGWDDHLRRKFGDYMQLPPESEREWKHHPLIIDFEHNYDELNLGK